MSRCSSKVLWVRFCGVWRVVWVGWRSILVDNATRPASFAKIHFSDLVPPRLYSKGRILGHKRAKRNTRPNTSLLQIEGVASKEDAQFYLGKRVAYVYRAKREVQGSKVRVIWGWGFFKKLLPGIYDWTPLCRRVTRPHGSSGVVKSKFRVNLPPRAFGASVRIVSTLPSLFVQLTLTLF